MQRTELEPGVFVTLTRAFVQEPQASDVLARLIEEIGWEQGVVRFFGKLVPEPRLSAWFGERDYTYSGRTVKSAPFTPTLASLVQRVEASADAKFNAVLVNRYRDGRDSMGFHSDDEPELGHHPVIASLSLRSRSPVRAREEGRSARSRVVALHGRARPRRPLRHGRRVSRALSARGAQTGSRRGRAHQPHLSSDSRALRLIVAEGARRSASPAQNGTQVPVRRAARRVRGTRVGEERCCR